MGNYLLEDAGEHPVGRLLQYSILGLGFAMACCRDCIAALLSPGDRRGPVFIIKT
jgi:hypothetical protein